MLRQVCAALVVAFAATLAPAQESYVNFEASHVHPIALTPSGNRLLAVNTPGASLEVFIVGAGGALTQEASIPVGLEPVGVTVRNDSEAWVANHLSDTISIVDLDLRTAVKTLAIGDEPTDIAFAKGRAFIAVSQEDAVKVVDLADVDGAPLTIELFSRDTRALAVSNDGSQVFAVTLRSGNQTSVVNASEIFGAGLNLDGGRLQELGLNDIACSGNPPPYPPLPPGVERNPALTDPADGVPPVGLIARWNEALGRWEDEAGQDWTHCLPIRLPDHDLFVIDAETLAQARVDHLGTSLFEVSVHPVNGRAYVPHTEARNSVRFEHELGVRGHMVDNRMAIVDPSNGNAVTLIDLNSHIDRGSDPAGNLAERRASISQPGMLVWKKDGSVGYLSAIGSRKVFEITGDPQCASGECIFGPSRAAPRAVEVGEGPTGVALHEAKNRLYVLNRFSNSIAVVDASALSKLADVPMNDPSSEIIKSGRRFLYDAIDSSGHGDAACSSCHLSGDLDGLAWDLGDPPGVMAPYSAANDNVRFVVPLGGQPVGCDPALCAAHDGFDPQKGPMTTQTLRGMLEPLHWRGDRPTMNDFNPAFVGLMGKEDIGPVNGKPAGLSAGDMERFRQFALGIRFPPNPYRNVDDTLPDFNVTVHGAVFSGNPRNGERLFLTHASDAGQPCTSCHQLPFGTAGGKPGGLEPGDPPAAATALFNGTADGSLHSDLEIPHMRNLYEKFGPVFGSADSPAQSKTGFGFTHDGSIPDMATFLSATVFTLTEDDSRGIHEVSDIATFSLHFPTGTRPAVGRHLTVPAGTPPTGAPEEEGLLAVLMVRGDAADPVRHCELTATALQGGRLRSYRLEGGSWTTDVGGEAPLSSLALRQGAEGSLAFLCGTLGSGARLGGDHDLDSFLDGDDCAPADAGSWAPPAVVANVSAALNPLLELDWDEQDSAAGPGALYDVAGGTLGDLAATAFGAAACLDGGLDDPGYDDSRDDPPPGEGYYYLVRAWNSCAHGGFGEGRESLDALDCAGS